jgi:serine/threonine-protein kinase
VVEEGVTGLSSVTNPLRQSRLRAAALFLAVTAGVLLVMGLLRGLPLWPVNAAVTCTLMAACALLSRRRPIPLLPLRVLEFTIFGLMAINLVVGQYAVMLHETGEDNATELQAAIKNTLIGSIILMFAYTMLIPNSWRMAAAVVLVFAAAPVVTGGVLFWRHPEAARFASQERVFLLNGTNLLLALISASLAVYGTHVLNTLRQEVFEARRLNQYQLGQRLGSGGMGDVYLAEHRLLKRPCALKLIRPESAGDRKTLARFEREVRSAARLSHPNIVDIYDYGHAQDGTFYYVMEYLSGLSLADLVGFYGPLPPGRAIYLLRQACDALAEAHAAGLIHRDLKPANIFAAHIGRRNDVAKLLDFGLVKQVLGESVELTAPGAVSGTPQYMAPEQATASKTLDHRADLYALGGVAYYLLTGRPPFEGDSVVAVMMANVRDPVVPPAQLRPGLPADLEQVVLRCLAKNPADRYPDAESLEQALAACADAGTWDARRAALWWQETHPLAKTSTPS